MRPTRRSICLAVIAAVLLIASPVASATGAGSTQDDAEAVASTCTDALSRCRAWIREDVVPWARDYANRTRAWGQRTATNTTSWAGSYAEDLQGWLETYGAEVVAWAKGDGSAYVEDVVDWIGDIPGDLRDHLPDGPRPECGPENCRIDTGPEPEALVEDLRPAPPLPSAPETPDGEGLVPELPDIPRPPTPDGPPGPGGRGPTAADAAPVGRRAAATPDRPSTDPGSSSTDPSTEPGAFTSGLGEVPVPSPGRPVDLVATLLVSGLLASLVSAIALPRLYRRIAREDILDNDLRAAMVDLVRERPAINLSQVADALDVARTTARYHARLLTETDHLVARRVGQETVLYVHGDHGPEDKDALHAVRHPTREALLDELLESPGMSMAEIGRRLDRDRSTIKHHVDELEDRDLLEGRREGRCRRVTVRDEAEPAIRRALDEGAAPDGSARRKPS